MSKVFGILAVLGALSCVGFLWVAYVIISDIVRDHYKKDNSKYTVDDMEDHYD